MLTDTQTSTATIVRVEELVRTFGRGEGTVRALDGVSLAFERGTFTAVMGPSGSGQVDPPAARGRA